MAAGALALDAAYRHFPAGHRFVAVVDPGVGSERRPIAVGAGRWLFVGPDNGLLGLVLDAHPQARVRLLANPLFHAARCRPSSTAATSSAPRPRASRGACRSTEVGPAVADPVRLHLPRAARHGDGWVGSGPARRPLRQPDHERARGGARRRSAGAARRRSRSAWAARSCPWCAPTPTSRPGRPARSSARAAGWRSPSIAGARTRLPARRAGAVVVVAAKA